MFWIDLHQNIFKQEELKALNWWRISAKTYGTYFNIDTDCYDISKLNLEK